MAYGRTASAAASKPKPQLRGFNPESVKINHIRRVTVLYGDDESGIAMRLDRFAEVLTENGIAPDIVPDADGMLSILRSSGLFSPRVACVCRDGIGFVKSDRESRGRLKEMSSLIESLPDGSYAVIGIVNPKSDKQMQELAGIASKAGGIIREVSLPYETLLWLIEHARTIGVEIDARKASDMVDACDGDPRRAADLVDMLGEGILSMDRPSIALIASNYGKAKQKIPNLMKPIAERDIDRLVEIRRSLPDGSAGDRAFILRVSSAVGDLLHASLDSTRGASWVAATNEARWHRPSFHNEWKTRNLANSTGGTERYARLNSYLMSRTLALYGFGDGVIATLPDLMSHIVA